MSVVESEQGVAMRKIVEDLKEELMQAQLGILEWQRICESVGL